jgi:cell division protein FtsQ
MPIPRPGAARPAATRPGGGTVSGTSAQRFAARVRRRRRRRVGLLGAALVLGLLVGWLMFGSTVLAVHRIEVRGAHRVPVAAVREAASRELGRSMALISPQQVAVRVVGLPLVAHATVVRRWPSTLVVTVTERQPIAAVPAAGGTVSLVDRDGVVVDTAPRAPDGLPLLQVDLTRAGVPALRAARQVYDDLPPSVRATVHGIRALSPDAVSFVLSDGSTVLWGSAQDDARKAAALAGVHPKPLAHPVTIDVTSPDTPALTGR